jgi:two-component SAPR family response regulator
VKEIQKEHDLKIEKCLLAVSLYEGNFLEELDALWIDEYRRYYREKYNHLVWLLADYYNREEYWEAISYYRKILKTEPFSEKAYSQLMLAFSKLGNKEAIKKIYAQLEQLFQEELDTKPSPTTTSLFKKLIS